MSGLGRLPGDELMPSRATQFLAAIRKIQEAHRLAEALEPDLFAYQLREVVAAKLSLRQAEERLVAVAKLRDPAA